MLSLLNGVASTTAMNKNTLLDFTGQKIVTIGTSLTDNGYQDASESASTIGYTARGYDSWVRLLTNQNINWINKGVAGNPISAITARISSDVIPEDPYAVIVEAGTNDSGQTYETITSNLETLYSAITDEGYVLIPLTIAMREATEWSDTIRDKMLDVNTWIKANYPHAIEVNEFFTSGGRPITGYTDDGTHFTNEGAFQAAKPLLSFVNTRTRETDVISNGTAVNTNPNLTGTGGSKDSGITGTVPDGIHCDIVGGHSGTANVTANEPGMSITFTPGSSGVVEDYQFRTNPLNVTTTAATAYELLSNISVSAWAGWAYIQLRIYEPGNGSAYDLYQILNEETYTYPAEAFAGLFRTAALTTNGTYVRIYLEVGIKDDATGTGTITLDNFKLREA